MGCYPTFYPTDSFGAVSDSSGKVILVNATLFTDFSAIIIEEQKNGYEQVKYTWKNARPAKHEILVGKNKWVSKKEWQAAIRARKNGTATKEQKEMLDNGHWKPKK